MGGGPRQTQAAAQETHQDTVSLYALLPQKRIPAVTAKDLVAAIPGEPNLYVFAREFSDQIRSDIGGISKRFIINPCHFLQHFAHRNIHLNLIMLGSITCG